MMDGFGAMGFRMWEMILIWLVVIIALTLASAAVARSIWDSPSALSSVSVRTSDLEDR